MPAGRPSKWTQEIEDEILSGLANGIPLTKICKRKGFPVNIGTIFDWESSRKLEGPDLCPSFVEFVEFFARPQTVRTGPLETGEKVRPEWHDQVFKAREWSEIAQPDLLIGDDLESERPEQKRDYIKGKVVSMFELYFEHVGEVIKPPLEIARGERNHPPTRITSPRR